MLGGDKDTATHNGGNQCTVPLGSINMMVSEESLLFNFGPYIPLQQGQDFRAQ